MMPILPHIASECIERIDYKKDIIDWPIYDEKLIKDENNIIVIQINGKKRGLINTKQDLKEDDLFKLIKKDQNINKYLSDKEIRKKIYIKNKLMNIII